MTRDSKADVALLLERISRITKETEDKRFRELEIRSGFIPSQLKTCSYLGYSNTDELLPPLLSTDGEMAETVKTLQRALDRLEPSQVDNDASHVHEKFIKSGLDMCIRRSNDSASQDAVPDCTSHLLASSRSQIVDERPFPFSLFPSGTITSLEVEHLEIIESGFYSVVCEYLVLSGTWPSKRGNEPN